MAAICEAMSRPDMRFVSVKSVEPQVLQAIQRTRANAHLRTLLIHGARAVLRTTVSKDDRLIRWVAHIAQTRHHNIAAVALANKTARIAWAMITKGTDYQPVAVAV